MKNIEQFDESFERDKWYWVWICNNNYEHYFVKQNDDWEWRQCLAQVINYDEQRDKAWDNVDMKEEWIEAVRNWDTEESYDRWCDSVDVFDFWDPSEYYSSEDDIDEELDDEWYLESWDLVDSYEYGPFDENSLNYVKENECYTSFYNWLQKESWKNQIEFLDCEDVR